MKTTCLLSCLVALALWSGCHPASTPDPAELAPPSQLVQSGWKATWSPDGKELAYGLERDQVGTLAEPELPADTAPEAICKAAYKVVKAGSLDNDKDSL